MSNNIDFNDSIDLKPIFISLWESKMFILLITFVFAIFSVFYSLSLKDEYTATMVVEEVVSQEASPAVPSGLGTFAALAGISVPGGSSKDKKTFAVELLKTRDFFDKLITEDDQLLNLLIAVDNYDLKSNTITYDESIYDPVTKKVRSSYLEKKTFNEIHSVFLNSISVKELETGSIALSVTHYSPHIAKSLLDDIFFRLNQDVKQIEYLQAKKSLDFLKNELSITTEVELKKVIAGLIDKQIQTIMISEIAENFVFTVIDSSRLPDEKSYPHRSLICMIITIFGFLLAIFLVVVRTYFKKE
tara:strand:- start:21806 stop:22711 length:906 start_codon:yes stop_codon:yes gene_type:complete